MKKYLSGFVFLFLIWVLIPSVAVAEFMILTFVTDSWGGKLIEISLGPDGADVGGQAVTFSITPDDGTASLSATSAETDSDGDISVRVSFENNASGSYTVTISVGTQSFDVSVSPPPLLLSMDCDNSSPEPGDAVTFTVSAVRGPFMAKGYTVMFSVSPDDGTASLSSTSETTGVSGRVQTTLRFGSDASGAYTVTASIGDNSVNGTVEVETALMSQQQLQSPAIIPPTDPPISQQQPESVTTQQPSDPVLVQRDSQTVPRSTPNPEQQDTKAVTQGVTNPVSPQQESRIVPRSVKQSKPKSTDIRPSHVAQDRIIFNEIRNAANDTNDWLEIRNISDTDIPLNDWEITIVTREGEKRDQDIDFVGFPEYTLPAGAILLIVNTDPSETSLVEGHNIEMPDAETEVESLYLLEETFILPNTPYLLILRSATDKNGLPEAFEDVMGNHFRTSRADNTQVWPLQGTARYDWLPSPLTQDQAWERVDVEKRGYMKEAWALSGYQNGVGYEPSASVETSVGTPGYPNETIVDMNLAGRITFSELMYATTGGLFSQSQWIELYNNTATAAAPINLAGWTLVIEARDSEARHRYSEITLEALEIASTETALLITRDRRHSGHLSEGQVYDLYEHHGGTLNLGLWENAVLSESGFSLQLFSLDGTLVDVAGNLDGEKGVDTPAWDLPSGWTEDGARTSLLRRYEDDVALNGTALTSWYRAADVDLPLEVYYGHKTDLGTPGYKEGGTAPVMLSHFHSERTDIGVIVEWTTASESNNAGFNILRSETKSGHYVKVNTTLILGSGTTSEQNTYSWLDTTAKANAGYYYRLEDVSLLGHHRRIATVRMKGHISASGKFLQTWADLKTRN